MLTRSQVRRKLARLFERIERNGNRFAVDYREPQFLGGHRRSSVVSVSEVWVFGSFARGAKECGDLDIIVYLTLHEGRMPTESALRRVVIGGLRDTDVLFGWTHLERRYEQDSDFDGACRIWTPDAAQWKSCLDEIQVSDSAARHPRKTDALPFSPKRAHLARDEAEEIVDAIEAGRLTSTFHELIDTSDHDWRQSAWARGHLSDAGRDRQKLLPTIFQWLDDHVDPLAVSHRRIIGVTMFINRMPWPRALDSIRCATILIAPHVRRGQTNGLWCLERGPEHPLVKKHEGLRAWTVVEDGRVQLQDVGDDPLRTMGFPTAVLFTSEADAQHELSVQLEIGQADPDHHSIAQLHGRDLLRAFGFARRVEVDGQTFPMDYGQVEPWPEAVRLLTK